jgi:hypothetical protein
MQRALLSWTLVFALLLAGFGASVLALNGDVFSAHGFVRAYLDALARHDSAEALQFDGVDLPPGVSFAMMTDDAALGDIDDIRFISDVEDGDHHVVRFATVLAGAEQVTEFEVERTGTRFGLFPTWRFETSPVATLNVSVDRDARFTANGLTTLSGDFGVLVPGVFRLGHDSKYLQGEDVTATVAEVNAVVNAEVHVTPKPEFTDAATEAIAAYLDDCVTQEVLKPTGCPFGAEVVNRLNSTPVWSMVEYPVAVVAPTETPGVWTTEPAHAIAHVVAEVKSLFDGTVSSLDEDVPFSTGYRIAIAYDDTLSVTAPPG